MAALALPVLEAIVLRVLAAIGVGVAGGVAVEEAQKRRKETDKASDEPIAKTDTKPGEKCKECPPDKGSMTPVNHSMSQNSADYQARITGFPPGMEWHFEDIDFDGFKSGLCLLQEAKADYDQFFDKDGNFRYRFQKGIFENILKQAGKQSAAVRRNPPSSLTYYFQTPMAYEYMVRQLSKLGISVQFAP